MTLWLFLLALTLRATGSGLRGDSSPRVFLAWLLNGIAAWLLASAVGAWAPFWPIAAVVLPGAYLELKSEKLRWRPFGDALVVVATGLLSAPHVAWTLSIPTALAAAFVGFMLDRTLEDRAPAVRWGIGLSPLVVLTVLLSGSLGSLRGHITGLGQIAKMWGALTVGVSPFDPGTRIELPTGAVAWFKRPPGSQPVPGVVVFHGNSALGAQQPAAEALRRALLHGGFSVLAVDHPGFGKSPLPGSPELESFDLERWNPLPHDLAALAWLQARPDTTQLLIAGHSMGTMDVLRVLGTPEGSALTGAVLFGGSLLPDPAREEYWHQRFHRERHGFGDSKLSLEQFRSVRDTFYDPAHLVAKLAPTHPPVLFVDFGKEGPDITASREQLFQRIPGSKEHWYMEFASHYFTVLLTESVLVGDTRPTQWVARRLQSFATDR